MAATSSVNFTSSRRSVGSEERRHADPLDVESPGHVKRPARAAFAHHRRAKCPIVVFAFGERLGAGRFRPAPHVQHALPLSERFEDQALAGLKIAAYDQTLIPMQNPHGRPVLSEG